MVDRARELRTRRSDFGGPQAGYKRRAPRVAAFLAGVALASVVVGVSTYKLARGNREGFQRLVRRTA